MINKLLLDKNIILDMVLGRGRKSAILEVIKNFDQHFISTHTFTTCFYILRRENFSKEEIYSYLTDFNLLEIDKNDCHLAFNLAKNIDDIEDCLELYTAKRNKAKVITADQKMVLEYGNTFDMINVS